MLHSPGRGGNREEIFRSPASVEILGLTAPIGSPASTSLAGIQEAR